MALWSLVTHSQIFSSQRMDAEYARPEYVQAENYVRCCSVAELGRLGTFVPGPFGSAFRVINYERKSPYRYIRGRDVKPFFLLDDDIRWIPESDFARLKHFAVKAGDLMISVVGTLGNVAICTSSETPAMFSCKSTLFRCGTANPYYLLAFLNCKSAKLCLLRRQRGAVQGGLNIEDLHTVPVPRFSERAELQVAALVQAAHECMLASRKGHSEATQLLESELGLDKLKFERPVGYTARLSESVTHGRFDADYFQTPFRMMEEHLEKHSTVPVGAIADVVKGVEVGSKAYRTSGKPFLRVSNIKETGLDLGPSDKYISDELYEQLREFRPQLGEVLVTKDGSPGVAWAVDNTVNGIISGGVVRLALKRDDIPAEYLALAINSRACQMQVERECSGALIIHWKPSSIRGLRIPLLESRKMRSLAGMVATAKQASRESDALLEQAKARVEQLIEEAAR